MSEEILFADIILHTLNDKGKAKVQELAELTGFTEENIRKSLNYLAKEGYVRRPLFITSISSTEPIPPGDYTLSIKGKEVIASNSSILEIVKNKLQGNSQTINQTNIQGNKNQVAQSGDNSSIIQIQDNSKINILRQLIENDGGLDQTKKKKLFGILKKFNTLKESGENAYELIKQVGLIAIKYLPLFFGLAN